MIQILLSIILIAGTFSPIQNRELASAGAGTADRTTAAAKTSDKSVNASERLYNIFLDPPREARPLVWWHWMNGNITADGLRKDMDWMQRSGIAGFHVFDANFSTPQIVEKRLKYMSPEWKEVFSGMLAQADSLGMEVTIASSPGFSATGGPWVADEDAMKKLVWREMQLEGGTHFKGALPEPYTVTGQYQNIDRHSSHRWYSDIAVLAVRESDAARTLTEFGARVSSSGDGTGSVSAGSIGKATGGKGPGADSDNSLLRPLFTVEQLTNGDLNDSSRLPADPSGYAWIQYEFPEPVSFKAMGCMVKYIGRGQHAPSRSAADTLLVSDDGVHFRAVAPIHGGFCQWQTFDFKPASGRFWRLKHKNIPSSYSYSQMKTTPAPGYTDIAEFVLYPETRVNHAEEKAAFASAWDLDRYPTPAADASDIAGEVVDLTPLVRDGRLSWDVPPGRWKVLRFGASLIGKQNHPASPEATGLEVDKLDPEAWSRYFHNYMTFFGEAAGGRSEVLRYLLADSYEADFQNWTPRLLEEFRARRGYDALTWMPALTGMVLESAERTEKFLWDWRRTIGELFEENYARMSDIARRDYGMDGCYIEAHANGRVFVADGMSIKRTAAWPMSEMWVPGAVSSKDRVPEGQADIRESASVSHIYGQQGVAAESLTSIGLERQAWSYHPANIKRTADLEMGAGVNRFVIHDSAHQPRDDKFPGLGLGVYGQWFNRHECWAEQAGAWTSYLARSCALLQEGSFSADVLWYYGENTNITAIYSHSGPDVPAGYNFDYVNPEALLGELGVSGGLLRTRSGMQYRLLCIDPSVRKMTTAVLRKLVELAEGGAWVCGPLPSGSPSLGDDGAEWAALQARLLACPQFLCGLGCPEALKRCGIRPDVDWGGAKNLYFVHRNTPEAEIYWVNNSSHEARMLPVSLRVSGMEPEIWHPEDGRREALSWSCDGIRTYMTLPFESDDAFFVVLTPTDRRSRSVPARRREVLAAVGGPWRVSFQEGRGAPSGFEMPALKDLSLFDEPGVKYFSGTAVYRCTFRVDGYNIRSVRKEAVSNGSANIKELGRRDTQKYSASRILLELGDVKNIAEVRVNGVDCGTVWKEPFTVDVSDAVRAGVNELEVRVTNLWPNRLIGDAQPDIKEPITYSPIKFYKASDPLLPSGLLGPVRLVAEMPVTLSAVSEPNL